MALIMADRIRVIRHLEYPVEGLYTLSPGGMTLATATNGWRYFENYGFLEYRMNNLMPAEEAIVTGRAMAAIALSGLQPNPGDTISVTLSGGNIVSPQTLDVTYTPAAGTDGRLILCAALANACNQNTVLQAGGVAGVAPYGTGAYAMNAVAIPEVAFSSPVSINISATGTGNVAPTISATGGQQGPSTQLQPNVTIWGYLNILDGLEGAMYGSSQNLDTNAAGPWKARVQEIAHRKALYRTTQGKLSNLLAIPLNPKRKTDLARSAVRRFM